MSKKFIFFNLLLLICLLHNDVRSQKKDRTEAIQKLSVEALAKECKELKAGQAVVLPRPDYPSKAKASKIGGTVLLTVKIDEKGNIAEIEKTDGHQLLQSAAISAARKSKFSPTVCDGEAKPVSAFLIYNFIPFTSTKSYFTPQQITEFTDIKNDSPYYEIVVNLTENYKLAFGYDDKRFYADAPLTRGEFAHFLRLTLDLLVERATVAGKIPREINLFNRHNPHELTSAENIIDLQKNAPFYNSVKILLLTYDISLADDKREFRGNLFLTNNETIEIWSKIFGDEAIPVNFEKTTDGDRIISRGEFALFLQESLQVLTYKVLP